MSDKCTYCGTSIAPPKELYCNEKCRNSAQQLRKYKRRSTPHAQRRVYASFYVAVEALLAHPYKNNLVARECSLCHQWHLYNKDKKVETI